MVEEGKVALEPAVYPQAGELRRFAGAVIVLEYRTAEPHALRPEIAEVGEPEDEQSMEAGIVCVGCQQGTRIGAGQCSLNRPYAGQQARLKPLANRDIQRMFEPLRITEQFLLKSTMREVLFRKPA